MCNAKEIIGNFIFIENNKKSNFLIIIIIIIILLLLIIFFIIFQKKYKKNSFNLESEINSNYKNLLKN
jgi:flagellar basal body-associated protein FliL